MFVVRSEINHEYFSVFLNNSRTIFVVYATGHSIKVMKKESKAFEFRYDTLGFYLDRAFNAGVKFLNKTFAENGYNIQYAQFTLMKAIEAKEGISQIELSKILYKDRGTITRTLQTLQKKGYIEISEKDKRTNVVSLSVKGRKILPELDKLARVQNDLALKNITKLTENEVYYLLESIAKNLSI